MKHVVNLGHIAIKVKDLDVSLDYYINQLGFPEMLRLHHDDGSVWLVYLKITDDQYLEIFPGAENDRAPGWNANGANHMCWTIDDLDACVADLKSKGITMMAEIKSGADGNRQAWLEDPDGNRIELMEMADDCLQYQAIKRLHAANS